MLPLGIPMSPTGMAADAKASISVTCSLPVMKDHTHWHVCRSNLLSLSLAIGRFTLTQSNAALRSTSVRQVIQESVHLQGAGGHAVVGPKAVVVAVQEAACIQVLHHLEEHHPLQDC